MSPPTTPPALLEAILRAFLPRGDRDALLADLRELYAVRLARHGRSRAGLWYLRQLINAPLRFLTAGSAGRTVPFTLWNHSVDPRESSSIMESIWQDTRFAVRTLARSPLYVAVVVATLAIGIGINSTIFTIVNAVLLRPLPVEAPDELVEIYSLDPNIEVPVTSSYPDFRTLAESVDSLAGLTGHAMAAANLRIDQASELVYGEIVTGNYFELLGIRPRLGRLIGPRDDVVPGGHSVVVLGNAFWRDRFAADHAIVGETLGINGTPYTVIGVAPASFTGLIHSLQAQIWVPAMMSTEIDPFGIQSVDASAGDTRPEQRGNRWLMLKGRLAEGATVAQVQAEVDAVMKALAERYPESNEGWLASVMPAANVRIHPAADGYLSPVAALLLGMVGVVLLSACTNIASMTLSRAGARSREVAMRLALGASKTRLVRQLLTESLLLAALGGTGGLVLTVWLRGLLLRFRPPLSVPMSWNLPIDIRVVIFTFVFALAAGLAFGVVPALRGSRTDLVSALKEGAHGSQSSGRFGLRGALVVLQVAVCAVLLVGATLLTRSVRSATEVDLGFDPHGLLAYTVDLDLHNYTAEEAKQFFAAAAERIAALPEVTGITAAGRLPLSLGFNVNSVYVEGRQVAPDDPPFQTDAVTVDGRYFDTVGVPLLSGRTFDSRDTPESRRVVIVSQAFERRHFSDGAVGERFRVGDLDAPPIEIIGVAADTKVRTVGEGPRPYVYFAREQSTSARSATLAVRHTGDGGRVRAAVRRELFALEPELVFIDDTDMTGLLGVALFPVRFAAGMLIGTGIVSLLLVSLGLYGVIAYSVAARAQEIGIRMALGATGSEVLRMVLRRGMVLVVIGAIIGAVGAAALGRSLRSVLYGVSALDPIAFGGAFLLLAVVATLANWIPARRAAMLNPIDALRSE